MKKAALILLLLAGIPALAQVNGWVASRKTGERIPFAGITVADTYIGTSTNENGNYMLNITQKGIYKLVFQSLGHKTREVTIEVTSLPHTLNVTLEEEEYILDAVAITNKEEAAMDIIRKAIDSRKANAKKTERFEADFYSRGMLRVKDVPEKILGQEIGDLGASLDSTRSGILYLSETVSKVKYDKPKIREQVVASKVSGEDNGFSFNNAAAAEFDFYRNYIPLEVNVVSPIADNALNYYNYRLESAFFEQGTQLINKIKVNPKRKRSPAMTGYIYIVDKTWELYAVDLKISGSQIEQALVDTLSVRQSFGYNAKEKLWTRNVQTLDFGASLFGVELSGRFSSVYSNFRFDPKFEESTFTSEILAFEENAKIGRAHV